jgi:hypothetical protein
VWSPDNSCECFAWVCLKDHAFHTNLHTVWELQVEIEAVAEEITGDMLCDTVDSVLIH